MQSNNSVGSDEVVRAVALFVEAGRNSLDWAALTKAVLEHRRECLERRRDRQALPGWFETPSERPDLSPPMADAEMLSIKLQSIVLSSIARMGEDWQRVIEGRAPSIRRCLEDFQSSDDPTPAERTAVISQIRILMQEMGELARDLASRVEVDLQRMEEELLPADDVWLPTRRLRRSKA